MAGSLILEEGQIVLLKDLVGSLPALRHPIRPTTIADLCVDGLSRGNAALSL